METDMPEKNHKPNTIDLESFEALLSESQKEMFAYEMNHINEINKTAGKNVEGLEETGPVSFALPGNILALQDWQFEQKRDENENEDDNHCVMVGLTLPGGENKKSQNRPELVSPAILPVLVYDAGPASEQDAALIKQIQPGVFSCPPALEDILELAAIKARHPETQITFSTEDQKYHATADSVTKEFETISLRKRRYFIEKILLGKKPSAAFHWLEEIGVLPVILPELSAGKGVDQNRFHIYDIYEHSLYSCDHMENADVVLRFSALLHDVGKVPTRNVRENGEATFYNHEIISSRLVVPVMKRFGIPKEVGLRVKFYVRNHMFHYTSEWSDRAIRRFMKKVPLMDLENLIKLRKADRKGSGKKNPFPKGLEKLINHISDVIARDKELKVTDLAFRGSDLMEMGLAEGPGIGRILRALLDEVKDEKIDNDYDLLRERAIALMKEMNIRYQEPVSHSAKTYS